MKDVDMNDPKFKGAKYRDNDGFGFIDDPEIVAKGRSRRIEYLKEKYGDKWREHVLPGDKDKAHKS